MIGWYLRRILAGVRTSATGSAGSYAWSTAADKALVDDQSDMYIFRLTVDAQPKSGQQLLSLNRMGEQRIGWPTTCVGVENSVLSKTGSPSFKYE